MATLAITGSCGYLGKALIERVLLEKRFDKIVGIDIRPAPDSNRIIFHRMDIRDPRLVELLAKEEVTDVVHLAFVVNPTHNPKFEYDVDVNGTKNLLDACRRTQVKNLIIASSIAAYGWHPDNPIPIPESHSLRGNKGFPYAEHKVIVERAAEEFVRATPQCNVTVLRICNVLGPNVHNAISAGIEAPVIFGVCGHDPNLAFTHEEDMTEILYQALITPIHGIFNVAGEGMVRLSKMTEIAQKRFIRLPVYVLRIILDGLFRFRMLPFGGGQMGFVCYSCVPDISKLKREFGYIPRHSSEETFREFVTSRITK